VPGYPHQTLRAIYYFAVLHQRQVKDIYPIVVFSFDKPFRAESDQYQVEVAGLRVLDFRFKAIQLNRMNWRDYLDQPNPVAAALMSMLKDNFSLEQISRLTGMTIPEIQRLQA
jgi:hypothetical protein